jgi:putative flippase GtrA
MADVTGAALSLSGITFGAPGSLRARIREARTRGREAHPLTTQVARYAVVGGLGTVANAVVFLVLRLWWEALPANLVALVLSTLLSTEINRRFTFGSAPPAHPWRNYAQTGVTVAFYAFYSSAVLITLELVVDDPSPWLQTLVISAASVLGGVGRYLVLRFWVFDGTARS